MTYSFGETLKNEWNVVQVNNRELSNAKQDLDKIFYDMAYAFLLEDVKNEQMQEIIFLNEWKAAIEHCTDINKLEELYGQAAITLNNHLDNDQDRFTIQTSNLTSCMFKNTEEFNLWHTKEEKFMTILGTFVNGLKKFILVLKGCNDTVKKRVNAMEPHTNDENKVKQVTTAKKEVAKAIEESEQKLISIESSIDTKYQDLKTSFNKITPSSTVSTVKSYEQTKKRTEQNFVSTVHQLCFEQLSISLLNNHRLFIPNTTTVTHVVCITSPTPTFSSHNKNDTESRKNDWSSYYATKPADSLGLWTHAGSVNQNNPPEITVK